MATTYTYIVDPDNGAGTNYTSLNAGLAAQASDITSSTGSNKIIVFECRASSGSADTTFTKIEGYKTSPTNYIMIKNHSSEPVDGKWNTSRYRLDCSSTDTLWVGAANVIIDGIQLRNTSSSQGQIVLAHWALNQYEDVTNPTINWIFRNCIYKVDRTGEYSSEFMLCVADWAESTSSLVKFYNNLVIGTNLTFYFLSDIYGAGNLVLKAYNNTFINMSNVASFYVGSGKFQFKNNLISGTTLAYFYSMDGNDDNDALNDYNAISVAKYSRDGSHSRGSQTFTFTNSGAGDYSLAPTDTGAKGYGTDLSGDISELAYDILGNPRSGSWDIGAFQTVIAGNIYQMMI